MTVSNKAEWREAFVILKKKKYHSMALLARYSCEILISLYLYLSTRHGLQCLSCKCKRTKQSEAISDLFTLRKFALLLHPLSIMFLLLLSDETQRQAERLGKDIRLPSVRWEQGEVNQLLPLVNTEDRNRNCLRLKITTD